jgi:hypothetical protein
LKHNFSVLFAVSFLVLSFAVLASAIIEKTMSTSPIHSSSEMKERVV